MKLIMLGLCSVVIPAFASTSSCPVYSSSLGCPVMDANFLSVSAYTVSSSEAVIPATSVNEAALPDVSAIDFPTVNVSEADLASVPEIGSDPMSSSIGQQVVYYASSLSSSVGLLEMPESLMDPPGMSLDNSVDTVDTITPETSSVAMIGSGLIALSLLANSTRKMRRRK
jgi:hypothetical protein